MPGADTWPISGDQDVNWGSAGGYLNFFAQSFHLSSDDRAESTQEGGGWAGAGGMIHNITLPYTNCSTTETATWDSGNNNIGATDANTGKAWFEDIGYDITEWVGYSTVYNQVNMEVSSAGFKGPVLRQRHYSWNLINRTGSAGEGQAIARICRKFQASVYPKMDPIRTADNIVQPPPMWTTTVFPAGNGEGPGVNNIGTNPVTSSSAKRASKGGYKVSNSGQFQGGMEHPVSTPGAWRWSMDPFTSVLLNVNISPTEGTEGAMTMTQTGWPLVTTLKISFLEVDQCIAKQDWSSIIPYSWAQNDSDSSQGGGWGDDYSTL
jgi:hypothetical protein